MEPTTNTPTQAQHTEIQYITPEQAKELIDGAGTTMFDVVFQKKDGTLRRMNAMKGVKKHLQGGTLKYNPKERGYVIVFDIKKQGYRTINLNTLRSLRLRGQKYIIT